MSISEVSLYKALKTKLGDETADELVEFVKSEVQTDLNNKTGLFLTKEDKIELLEKMNKDKNELLEKINKDKNELLEKMNKDKIDLLEKMNKDKIDLVKWMFGFWITIVLMLVANWFLK